MKSNFSGIVVAILTGAVLGVLLAPRSGKETRRKFSSDSDKFLKDLQDSISSGFDSIRQQYEDVKDNVTSKYNDARDNVSSRYNDAVDSAASQSKSAIERAERNSKY